MLGEEIIKFDSALLSFVPDVSYMPSSVVTVALNYSRNIHNIHILIEELRAQVTVVEGLKTIQLLFRIVHWSKPKKNISGKLDLSLSASQFPDADIEFVISA